MNPREMGHPFWMGKEKLAHRVGTRMDEPSTYALLCQRCECEPGYASALVGSGV